MKKQMIKKYLPFVMASLILCISLSCFKEDYYDNDNGNPTTTITGTGELVEKYFDLDEFTKISLVGQANINIIKGDTQSVKISAQNNIFDALLNEVKDGVFNIGVKNNYSINTSKGIHVEIVTPSELTMIGIVGAGKVNFEDNKQTSLTINITGAGEVNAFNIEVDNCTISITGAGSCNANVNKLLRVNISGTGLVYYKGEAEVISNVAGTGSIIKID